MVSVTFDEQSLAREFSSRRPERLTIPNEDVVREYVQAKVVGRGEEYKEFVESDDDLSEGTKDAVERLDNELDSSEYVTLDELERDMNNIVRDLYDSGKVQSGLKEIENQFNNQMRNDRRLMTDGGKRRELEREFGSTDIVVSTIEQLTKFLKILGSILTFAGVAVSMLLRAASRYSMGAGMLMLCMTPIVVLGSIGSSSWETSLVYVSISATAAIAGGLGMKAFDALTEKIDQLHTQMIS